MIPVGQKEIAERAKVQPDTVKKWREREVGFPQPKQGWTVGGSPAWEWAEVLRWLQMTGRAPHFFRYREINGPERIRCQALDGDDQWQTLADFHCGNYEDRWTAYPSVEAVEEMGGDKAAAQAWADRLLAGWEEARTKWVKVHPDEPMPAHLLGTRTAGQE